MFGKHLHILHDNDLPTERWKVLINPIHKCFCAYLLISKIKNDDS
jgi:hypothetical protein